MQRAETMLRRRLAKSTIKGNNAHGLEDFRTEIGSCQGQNSALTVLFVPSLLISVLGVSAESRKRRRKCEGPR